MTAARLGKQLLAAANKLVEKELVARTWGNISMRIDGRSFLVTPSGIPYETLTTGDLVTVMTDTLDYKGNIKPSSEKHLHALIYQAKPDISAVAHTHQFWASAVAAAGRDIPASFNGNEIIPCTPYALPTTKTLSSKVIRALTRHKANAVLLANHGAVCIGGSLDEAIHNAEVLEKKAYDFIMDNYKRLSGDDIAAEERMIQYFIKRSGSHA